MLRTGRLPLQFGLHNRCFTKLGLHNDRFTKLAGVYVNHVVRTVYVA